MRIEVDPSGLTEREESLARLVCDVAYVDALPLSEDERKARLEAVADALSRLGVRARVTD